MADSQIRFDVGFNVDKSGLQDVKKSISDLANMTSTDFMKINPKMDTAKAKESLVQLKQTAHTVGDALEAAMNPKLGTVNIAAFEKKLKDVNLDIKTIEREFSKAGAQGQKAFLGMSANLLKMNTQVKQTVSFLDKMGQTLANTIKWNVSSSAVNAMAGSVRQAYGYVKALDTSLNNIMIVSGKSADEMARFATQANNAAKSLGKTTTDYTDAALTFYQQGLDDKEVQARADLTLKVANASGLGSEQSAEYVTSVLNGYKVAAEDAEKAMDILAKVGAETASSLDELAEGMAKVASTANAMGVSEEQLAATLSTVISTTRQDAASVGTAFKTIYARIADIEAGTEDAEVSLGNYTKKMAEMGFNVLDESNHLRDLGEVIEEIGGKWGDMSREQQIALAQTMAGTRQYNNLIALFDGWEQYETTLRGAQNATGTLQQQQDTYMESTAAHLKQLKAAKEDLFDSLLDADSINSVSDGMSAVINVFADFVDSIGGGSTVLTALGAVILNLFKNQIGQAFFQLASNLQQAKQRAEDLAATMRTLPQFQGVSEAAIQRIAAVRTELVKYEQVMTQSQKEEFNNIVDQVVELEKKKTVLQENQKLAKETLTRAADTVGTQGDQAAVNNLDFQKPEDLQADYGSKYEEVLDKVIAKTDDAKEQQETFRQSLNAVNSATNKYNTTVSMQSDSIQKLTQQKANYEKSLTRIQTALKNTSLSEKDRNNLLKAQASIEGDLTNVEKQLSQKQEELKGSSINLKSAMSDLTTVVETYEMQESDILKLLPQQSSEYKRLVKAIEEVKTAKNKLKNGGNVTDADQKALQNYVSAFKNAQVTIQNDARKTKEILVNESNGASVNIEQNIKRSENAMKQLVDAAKMAQLGKGFAQMLSATASVASAIQSIVNVTKIWKDESLSTGEKILQTISGLSFALMSLGPVITNLSQGVPALFQGVKAFAAGINGVTIAVGGLNIALGPLLLVLLAIAAAIAAVVVAVKLYEKAQNKAKDALENANKELANAEEGYKNAKQAAEDFKNTVSDYKKGIEALKDLKKGTVEYQEAVKSANEQAKELIDAYNLIEGKDYTFDKNGVANISDDTLQRIQRGKDANANEQERILANAQINQKQASTDYDSTVLSRDLKDKIGFKLGETDEIQQIASVLSDIYEHNWDATSQEITAELSARGLLTQEISENIDKIIDNKDAFIELAAIMEDNVALIEQWKEKLYLGVYGESVENTYKDEITSTDKNGKEITNERRVAALEGVTADTMERLVNNTAGFDGKKSFDEAYNNWVVAGDDKKTAKKLDKFVKDKKVAAFETGASEKDAAYNNAKKLVADKNYAEAYKTMFGAYDATKQDDGSYIVKQNSTDTGKTYTEEAFKAEIMRSFAAANQTTIGRGLLGGNEEINTKANEARIKEINDRLTILNNQGRSVNATDSEDNARYDEIDTEIVELEQELADLQSGKINALEDRWSKVEGSEKAIKDFIAFADSRFGEQSSLTDTILQIAESTKDGNIANMQEILTPDALAQFSPEQVEQMQGQIFDEAFQKESLDFFSALGVQNGQAQLDAYAEYIKNNYNAQDYFQSQMDQADNSTDLNNLMSDAEGQFAKEASAANGDEAVLKDLYSNYADTVVKYGESLHKLAEEYDNAKDEAAAYEEVQAKLTATLTAAGVATDDINESLAMNPQFLKAQSDMAIAVAGGEAAEKFGISAEDVESMGGRMVDNFLEVEKAAYNAADGTEKIGENAEATAGAYARASTHAANFAVANIRLNRGLETLRKSFKQNTEIIKTQTEYSIDYCKAMDEMKDSLADIFNVSAKDLPDSFIQTLINDGDKLQKIMEGDIATIDAVRLEAADSIALNIIAQLPEDMQQQANDLWTEIQTCFNNVQAERGSPEYTAELNKNGFVEKMNQLITETGMSVEQIQSLLGSMGVSAKLKTDYEIVDQKVPVYETEEAISTEDESVPMTFTGFDEETKQPITQTVSGKVTKTKKTSYTKVAGYKDVKGAVEVATIESVSGGVSSGGSITKASAGTPNLSNTGPVSTSTSGGNRSPSNSSSSGGGGSSSGPSMNTSKIDKKADRFTVINKALSDQERIIARINKQRQNLIGDAFLRQIDKENVALKKTLKYHAERLALQDNEIADKKAAFEKAAQAVKGYGLQDYFFGAPDATYEGALSYYGITYSYRDIQSVIDNFDKSYTSYTQEQAEEMRKNIEQYETAAKEYFDALTQRDDWVDDYIDTVNQILENKISKLEFRIGVNAEITSISADAANMTMLLGYPSRDAEERLIDTWSSYANWAGINENLDVGSGYGGYSYNQAKTTKNGELLQAGTFFQGLSDYSSDTAAKQQYQGMSRIVAQNNVKYVTDAGEEKEYSSLMSNVQFAKWLAKDEAEAINGADASASYFKESAKQRFYESLGGEEAAQAFLSNMPNVKLEQLFDDAGGNIANYTALADMLDTTLSNITEGIQEVLAGREQVIEGYKTAINLVKEERNILNKIRDARTSILQTEQKILELQSKTSNQIRNSDLIDSYNRQLNNEKATLESAKSGYGFFENQLIKTQQQYEAALKDPESRNVESAREMYKEAFDNFQEATSTLQSSLEREIDLVVGKYEAEINAIFTKIEQGSMTTGYKSSLGVDYQNKQIELLTMNEENYLDTLDEAFAKQKLAYKWQSAIDSNNDNVLIQQRLNKLMKERMAYLEQKDQLSQKEVEREEKLIELELKRIALEEAQANKSKMRLRRDASGNYSYQYVSDTNNINQARQDLAQAENDLWNFDKEVYNSSVTEANSLWNNYLSDLKQIYLDNKNNPNAIEAQVALLDKQYGKRFTALKNENTEWKGYLNSYGVSDLPSLIKSDFQTGFLDKYSEGNMVSSELKKDLNNAVADYGSEMSTISKDIDELVKEWTKQNESIEKAIISFEDSIKRSQTDADGAYAQVLAANKKVEQVFNELCAALGVKGVGGLANFLKESYDLLLKLKGTDTFEFEQNTTGKISEAYDKYGVKGEGGAVAKSTPVGSIARKKTSASTTDDTRTEEEISRDLYEQDISSSSVKSVEAERIDGGTTLISGVGFTDQADLLASIITDKDLVLEMSQRAAETMMSLAMSQTTAIQSLASKATTAPVAQSISMQVEFPNVTSELDIVEAAFKTLPNIAAQSAYTPNPNITIVS